MESTWVSSKTGQTLITKSLPSPNSQGGELRQRCGFRLIYTEKFNRRFNWQLCLALLCLIRHLHEKHEMCLIPSKAEQLISRGCLQAPAALPLLQEGLFNRGFMRRSTAPKELSLPSSALPGICQQDRWTRKTSDRTTTNPRHFGTEKKKKILSLTHPLFLFLFEL